MSRCDGAETWGPPLWAELHTSDGPATLPSFIRRIPGRDCRLWMQKYIRDNPPPVDLSDWRRWTWECHNAKRRDLNQTEMTYADAATLYGWR